MANDKDIIWDDEITWDDQQPAQQAGGQQQNILSQLMQATQNTVGGLIGGLIRPPTQIVGRAGQTIESILSGQPPQSYNIPLPPTMGGNIPIQPAQNAQQALAPVAQTTAMMLTGNPAIGGALYGAGMGAEEGSAGNIAGGALLGGLLGVASGVAMGKYPAKQILRYDNSLKRAETAKTALDALRTKLGQAKEIAMQEVKDVPVNFDWNDIPHKALEVLRKPDSKVLFDSEGKIVNTMANTDRVKVLLQDMPSQKDFVEAGKLATGDIIRYAGKVRDAMVNAVNKVGKPELGKALSDYHNFMNNYYLINDKLVDKHGNALANKLKSVFKWDAEPLTKRAWKEVSKASPEIKSVMGSMNRRELLKNLLKLTGAGIAIKKGVGLISALK